MSLWFYYTIYPRKIKPDFISKDMKILYIITKSNWGGAQKYVFDLASHQKKQGQDVAVAFGGEGILAQRLKEKGIKTIQIPGLERNVSLEKEVKVIKNLYKILKTEKPEIIHLNSSKIGVLGSLLGRAAGIKKIVFTAHGWPFREERPLGQILIIKFLSWLSIVFSHQAICVSKKDFVDVKNWPLVKNKITIVHNGIDLKESANELSQKDNSDIVKIISIAELHKNKGLEYGLKTISLLKNKIQNFKYTIFSFGGDEEEKIKEMIKELNLENFVELKISQGNHHLFLKDADIYFMPSLKEGLPYALLEAGNNSLPVVASDTGGISEIIENYKNGFLIQVKDVNAFELALEKLIQDKNLREEFGRKAKEKIIREFDLKKMLQETEKVYQKFRN